MVFLYSYASIILISFENPLCFASLSENYQSGSLHIIFLEDFVVFGGPGHCLLLSGIIEGIFFEAGNQQLFARFGLLRNYLEPGIVRIKKLIYFRA